MFTEKYRPPFIHALLKNKNNSTDSIQLFFVFIASCLTYFFKSHVCLYYIKIKNLIPHAIQYKIDTVHFLELIHSNHSFFFRRKTKCLSFEI